MAAPLASLDAEAQVGGVEPQAQAQAQAESTRGAGGNEGQRLNERLRERLRERLSERLVNGVEGGDWSGIDAWVILISVSFLIWCETLSVDGVSARVLASCVLRLASPQCLVSNFCPRVGQNSARFGLLGWVKGRVLFGCSKLERFRVCLFMMRPQGVSQVSQTVTRTVR